MLFCYLCSKSDKILKALKKDDYILGITSSTPAVLGNSGELRWKNKYVMDEWGRVQYQDVVISAEMDEQGNVISPKHTESQPILNPEWNPAEEYIPRLKRPEWVAVGLLGQLLVRDDGTCKPGKYCIPNNEGVATYSNKGYRVMKRTGPNQILVLFNGNRIT
ncbi:peptidase G2 autoproteolytic cleavage domain-containing protein [Bacillus sp. UNC437CL72CviS29]|uniref:peptidase G2 autoproteolytic cleavage domain-containing protein n=1 Tax=Bacillus sp. UNC437CL72CviS29 TaxID=1340430 RepID=UPI0009DFFF77|nr:peptidase G2 autoproteolytic cleavage domain-containing protein [Bacillus sp. UNC437CL72CviS29]